MAKNNTDDSVTPTKLKSLREAEFREDNQDPERMARKQGANLSNECMEAPCD